MSLKRIVLWRHGQTVQNLNLRIQGSQDFPLNDKGIEQALEVAPELAKLNPTKIIVSDLTRAKQTAQFLADETGIEPIVDERLRERSYGLWEGLNSDEIKIDHEEQWLRWRSGFDPEGVGVETRFDCGKRVAESVEEFAALAEESDVDETLIFVGHGGAITAGMITLLGQNPSEWNAIQGLENCRWALLAPRPEAEPRWRLKSYNRKVVAESSPSHFS